MQMDRCDAASLAARRSRVARATRDTIAWTPIGIVYSTEAYRARATRTDIDPAHVTAALHTHTLGEVRPPLFETAVLPRVSRE